MWAAKAEIFRMQILRGTLAAAAIVLTSCSSLPVLPLASKPSIGELGLTWHSTGIPVSLQRFIDDRNKCLVAARQIEPDSKPASDAQLTKAFMKCFRAAGYVPSEPRRFLEP
jgi:hypothetical protein